MTLTIKLAKSTSSEWQILFLGMMMGAFAIRCTVVEHWLQCVEVYAVAVLKWKSENRIANAPSNILNSEKTSFSDTGVLLLEYTPESDQIHDQFIAEADQIIFGPPKAMDLMEWGTKDDRRRR
jgi:hypothetical protein